MSTRQRGPLLAVGAMAVAAAGTYAAERVAVARWSAAPDSTRDEPREWHGVEHRVESADGTPLHAMETGDGPTVILAHGYTATTHHWAPVAARLLTKGIRVVAFDQRGHGRSGPGPGRFGTAELADDLAAVVAATAPDGAVIAGHSMGGIGAQAMLAHHPTTATHVHGLILAATVARPVQAPLSKLMGRLGGTALARTTMAHPVHGRIMARGGLGRRPAITTLDVVRGGWADCSDATRAGVMRDLKDFDFSDMLVELAVPTTVVCGDLDNVTPPAESRRMAELIPNASLQLVPGCGHSLPWEAADLVSDIIAEHTFDNSTTRRP